MLHIHNINKKRKKRLSSITTCEISSTTQNVKKHDRLCIEGGGGGGSAIIFYHLRVIYIDTVIILFRLNYINFCVFVNIYKYIYIYIYIYIYKYKYNNILIEVAGEQNEETIVNVKTTWRQME